MNEKPYFSIVIPAFNREREVTRAIHSCLTQDFRDFEICVVDDGSSDGTAQAIERISDSRIRLVRHARNRGVCPARNSGVRVSSGAWIVFLDSDHELLPHCLTRIYRETLAELAAVSRLGFMYEFDDGRISPDPLPPNLKLGYREWLRWIQFVKQSDALWVTRRSCFDTCMMPESFALEFSYGLDFSRHFVSRLVPERVAFQHTDSSARLTLFPVGDASTARSRALDQADDWEHVLCAHGDTLRDLAPARHRAVLRGLSICYAMADLRLKAAAAGILSVKAYPRSAACWLTIIVGLMGPAVALWANAVSHRWRNRRTQRHGRSGLRTDGPRIAEAA